VDRWPRPGSIKEQEETAMHRNVLRVLATMLVMLGLLTLGVTPAVAQEEPTVEVTIDQATIDLQTGEVTLTGTMTGTATCSDSGSEYPVFVEIYGQLRQRPVYPHPHTVLGYFYEVVAPCPGPEGATFSVTFSASYGRFRPGSAHLSADIIGCAPIYPTSFCEGRFYERLDTTIQLTPAR
jgi:hypothetical protein